MRIDLAERGKESQDSAVWVAELEQEPHQQLLWGWRPQIWIQFVYDPIWMECVWRGGQSRSVLELESVVAGLEVVAEAGLPAMILD